MKRYKKSLFLICILFSIIFLIYPFNVKGITLSSIKYTFKNDNLYNSTNINFNESTIVNVKNSSEYTGHYPATYSFENETGLTGSSISYVDSHSGSSASLKVVEEYYGHKEVLQWTPESQYHKCYSNIERYNGILEFWFSANQTSLYCDLQIYDGSQTDSIWILIRTDMSIDYKDGVSVLDSGKTYSVNVWTHFKITWNLNTDWHFWINGISIDNGNGIDFYGNPSLFDKITFQAGHLGDFGEWYFDAIDYSWITTKEIYNFTNDILNQPPKNWITNNDIDCSTNVIYYYPEIYYVLEVLDESDTGKANITRIFNNTVKDYIEFDFQANTNQEFWITFKENDTIIIDLRVLAFHVSYHNGSDYTILKENVFEQFGYVQSLKLLLNLESNTYDFYHNNTLEVSNIPFLNNITEGINTLNIYTDVVSDDIFGNYYCILDNLILSLEKKEMGSNIIPTLEINPFFKEVDTFEFDLVSVNTLYDIGSDNPSDWTDIENGYDHTNIAQDNTDISEGSVQNHRVVQIDGIGSTHELTGIKREFDILNGIINISMNYNLSILENNDGNFYISIYSKNLNLQVKILANFFNPSIFGANLTYYNGSEYIILNEFSTIASLQEINYYIYIDSFVMFKITTDGSLGFKSYNYTFPLINPSNKGLGKIEIVSDSADDSGNDNIYYIKNIGVYSNGISLSDDFGYLPLRITEDPIFWTYLAHNLFRINAFGSFAIYTASYEDWILEGNMEVLRELDFYNYTLKVINSYFIEFVHFPSYGIFNPILVFFIKSQFNVSSITIDGIKFFDDTPHDFGFATYESGGVDNSKSYFYINEANKIEYNLFIDQEGVKEFIQMEFEAGAISTNNSAVQFSTSKSEGAYGFFRVKYIYDSSIFEIPIVKKTTRSILPNDKSIQSYIILITDNNDNQISGLTIGSLSSFTLLFTSDIIATVITLSLLAVLIPLIIIIIPSLAFSSKFGKFLLAPFFLLMSIVCIVSGLIPTWLFFIIVLSLSLFIFQENERGVNDTF